MTKDMEHNRDEKTVLVNRQEQGPAQGPLTDFAGTPNFEQLEARMIYAARLHPAERFNVSLNALVAAASELLSEVVRLKSNSVAENVNELHKRLTHEMNMFDARAASSGVENSEILLARYVLCTVVDEAIVTTAWGSESQWSKISLLGSFHNETSGGEKVFRVLDDMSRNPAKNLPMLELLYLCLSLGFEGKYRVMARGMLELEGIRDALYRQIRQLRGDVSRELSPHWEGLNDKRQGLVRIVPWWMVGLFTVVCLGVMYAGFAWVLGEQRDTVMQPYQQQLDPSVVQPQQPHRDA